MIDMVRRCAWVAFVAGALLVGGTGLAARVAPLLGHELFAIRSGSMEPALGVGSLAFVDSGRTAPRPGEAIAYRLPSGTVVIHRVVATGPDGIETRGDANEGADPGLVPPAAVVGTVGMGVPLAGYLLGMLSMPSGVVAIMAILGTLLATAWMLDEPGPATRHRPGTVPVRTRSG